MLLFTNSFKNNLLGAIKIKFLVLNILNQGLIPGATFYPWGPSRVILKGIGFLEE